MFIIFTAIPQPVSVSYPNRTSQKMPLEDTIKGHALVCSLPSQKKSILISCSPVASTKKVI